MPKQSKELELYIHIPFCKKKCNYCDFLSGNKHLDNIDSYVNKLISEIEMWGKKVKFHPVYSYKISTIFIGGGTPSILSVSNIKDILNALKSNFKVNDDAEITMEMNPESVTLLKAKGFYQAGINRVSLGLQSIHEDELKELGRIHDYETFKDALFFLHISKFKNINVDLMYGIPGQSLDSWEETLKVVTKERITHISAYNLIIEPGTPFDDMKDKLEEKLPDEDTVLEMEKTTKDILENAGFNRYEISNYSKEGFECKHNLGYWSMTEYLGFGIGASSYYQGKRFSNTKDYCAYMISEDLFSLQNVEREANMRKDVEEFIFLGLRKIEGISIDEFKKRFNEDIYNIYGNILDKYIGLKYIKEKDSMINFTNKGINISNKILSEFLLDD